MHNCTVYNASFYSFSVPIFFSVQFHANPHAIKSKDRTHLIRPIRCVIYVLQLCGSYWNNYYICMTYASVHNNALHVHSLYDVRGLLNSQLTVYNARCTNKLCTTET